jgi:hypothetical protein
MSRPKREEETKGQRKLHKEKLEKRDLRFSVSYHISTRYHNPEDSDFRNFI